MRVYDFDQTIYRGDSTVRFYGWLLRRYPRLWPRALRVLGAGVLYRLHALSLSQFKQVLYRSFVPHVPLETEVNRFWRREQRHIKSWYHEQHRPSDLISSASPDFLLQPIAKILDAHLLASQVDPKTGRLLGPNHRGTAKVATFRATYPHTTISEFYSDSRSDHPLAQLATKAYLVRGDQITPWPWARQ
jgi:phosphoserine phosphatase